MRILDKNNIEIADPDYSVGYLKEEKILVAHRPSVEAVPEQGHYEVIAEYPNGGRDLIWIVDVPAVEAADAWDEYEDILRYVEYSEEELAEIEKNKQDAENKAPVSKEEYARKTKEQDDNIQELQEALDMILNGVIE